MRHQQGQGIIISHIFRQIVFLMPPCCQIIALETLRRLEFKFQMLINEILIFSFALTIQQVEKLMLLHNPIPTRIPKKVSKQALGIHLKSRLIILSLRKILSKSRFPEGGPIIPPPSRERVKGLSFPLFIPEPSRHMFNAFFGIAKAKVQLSLTSNPSLGPWHRPSTVKESIKLFLMLSKTNLNHLKVDDRKRSNVQGQGLGQGLGQGQSTRQSPVMIKVNVSQGQNQHEGHC